MYAAEKNDLLQRATKALDAVRPHLEIDGGDVEIVDITEDFQLQIKWLGACENCAMSKLTLKAGIEQAIFQQVPEIKSVVPINYLNEQS